MAKPKPTRPVIGSLLALAAAVGCRAAATPAATILPTAATTAAAAPRLESAYLVCRFAAPPQLEALPAVTPAAYQSAGVDANPRAAASGVVRVIAISYPHPDGRRDVARAELVIADPAAASSHASWRERLAGTLTAALPGVAWGPGIRRAVALDVTAAELRELIASAQAAQGQTPAPADAASPALSALRMALNGAAATTHPAPPQLGRLAARLEREGRAISYPSSTAELLAATAASP